MGLKTLKNKSKVKSLILEGKSSDYERPGGEILVKKDKNFDVIFLEINAEG